MFFDPLPQHRQILNNIQIALFMLTKLILDLVNRKNEFSTLLISTIFRDRHFTTPHGLRIIIDAALGLKIIKFFLFFSTNR